MRGIPQALQGHPSLPLIPSKHIIALRLSQCLNPALPSGVHQKAIQLYGEIFRLIGRDGLASDLALWTPGLSTVLTNANLNTTPPYLELLFRYYVPLGTRIRPALKSIILALLPGIDEEGGEYFDQTLELIDSFRTGVQDDSYFWQCVMLATMTSPTRRQGALALLVRRLPKLGPEVDSEDEAARQANIEALITPEPGLLVRALCAGLGDEQLLVQRGFLDLLVANVPLSSEVIQKRVSKPDLQLLVTSAAGVVLRRDMGLNRRLWAWFLGPDEGKSLKYFQSYGAKPLVGGLLEMLQQHDDMTPAERAKPYRLCLSFMDRWEVGAEVVPKVFATAIESLRDYERTTLNKENYTEVFKSASMFFDGVEASLIWKQVWEKIERAFVTREKAHLQTVRFIIRTFNVREEEMIMVHAPVAVLSILLQLSQLSGNDHDALKKEAFLLTEDIWDIIPEAAFGKTKTGPFITDLDDSTDNILPLVREFYDKGTTHSSGSSGALSTPPFLPPDQTASLIFSILASLTESALSSDIPDIATPCRILAKTTNKIPRISDPANLPSLTKTLHLTLAAPPIRFSVLSSVSALTTAFHRKQYLNRHDLNSLVSCLIQELWSYLSPESPKYHVEAVKSLWSLQNVLQDRTIEAAIATAMMANDVAGTYSSRDSAQGRRFTVLWMHSVGGTLGTGIAGADYHMVLTRPLLLFVDALADDGSEMSVFARGWLQNLGSVNRLFWIFIGKMLEVDILAGSEVERDEDGAPKKRKLFEEHDEVERATYLFETLGNVLRVATDGVLQTLASELVVAGDEARGKLMAERGYGSDDMTLQMLFAQIALRAIEGDPRDPQDPIQLRRVLKLHKMALSVLHHLLLSRFSKPLAEMALEDIITARLTSIMKIPGATYIQVSLLDVLHAALKLSLTRPTSHLGHLRQVSKDHLHLTTKLSSIAGGHPDEKQAQQLQPPPQFTPPKQLLKCLLDGFSSLSSRPVLDSWIFFLAECLPLFEDVIFQMLIPLVECLCTQVRQTFDSIKLVFTGSSPCVVVINEAGERSPESTLVALLNGLEQILAAAHAQLLEEEHRAAGLGKSLDSPHTGSGFFNAMVSGVFTSSDGLTPGSTSLATRSTAANNRLTVLLCFQDTVKLCYSIWSWADIHTGAGSGANETEIDPASRESWTFTSLRMKARARRILEHMFAAETLECLETLMELWPQRLASYSERAAANVSGKRSGAVFKLINVLDGSRPKHTIPAIFNALYSRTNPAALDPARRSTLTAELSDIDVAAFLVEYARSLEDDAMDEIWDVCVTFLKDVLANPFPHRQILPGLVAFAGLVGEKVENSGFGEQRRYRRELGDLWQRLLTSCFTTTPVSLPTPTANAYSSSSEKKDDYEKRVGTQPDDIKLILLHLTPSLPLLLLDPDRVMAATNTITTSLLQPCFKSKRFPDNLTPEHLHLLLRLSKLPATQTQKAWRPVLSELLMTENKLFYQHLEDMVEPYVLPLTRQLSVVDRDILPSLIGRLTPPTQLNTIFNINAVATRSEVDTKTILNLKRIAMVLLSSSASSSEGQQNSSNSGNIFVSHIPALETALVSLLSGTQYTAPSSAVRTGIYLVLRALILTTPSTFLSGFWPVITAELNEAFLTLSEVGAGPGDKSDKLNVGFWRGRWTEMSLLGAAKLWDALLVMETEEMGGLEWTFMKDTSEAVGVSAPSYSTSTQAAIGLLDEIAPELQAAFGSGTESGDVGMNIEGSGKRLGRKAWFKGREGRESVTGVLKEGEIIRRWVVYWVNGVAAEAFEGVYRGGKRDEEGVRKAVVKDIWDEV